MADTAAILIGTVTSRPYVFAFFAGYLWAAVTHLGWKKTLLFTVCGYLIAFGSEYSSIHTGIPYGWYYYLDTTSDRELWVAGVPFFDSLSYLFLSYCSYATALLILGPIKAWRTNIVVLETRQLRRSAAVLCLAALLQTFLDTIIDPVALQGRRWFLGQIYGYREVGVHYGVPLSNYGGWLVVSGILVLVLQVIDAKTGNATDRPVGMSSLPFRALMGPVLYLSVLVFNLVMTLMIGEQQMAATGALSCILPLAMATILTVRRTNRYTREELAAHVRDFPHSPVNAQGV
jgi:putative membrane protein